MLLYREGYWLCGDVSEEPLPELRYVKEMGADIIICDVQSNTSLHIASFSFSLEIIKILPDKSVSVNLTKADFLLRYIFCCIW